MSLIKILKNPFVLATLLYISLVIVINPIGEFAVNDDWAFVRQVEHGVNGSLKISSIIDPSFIAQNLLGVGWARLFGPGFTSLRFLTIFITVVSIWGIYRFLKLFDVGDFITLCTLLISYFNPLVFTSSMSFMGEAYILFGFIWSTYFYVKGYKTGNYSNFIHGSLFAGFALLVRQSGIVLFIAFFLFFPFIATKNKGWWKILLPNILIFLASFLIMAYWPRYVGLGVVTAPGISDLASKLVESKYIGKKLKFMLFSLPYFSFFIFPFLVSIKTNISKWFWLLIIPLSFALSWQIFKLDLFPVGSVFYIEELYSKSNYRFNLSLFNNIPLKLFISFIIGYSLIKLLSLLFTIKTKLKKEDLPQMFLTLVMLGAFFINFFANDYYDRYLVPSIFSFIMLFIVWKKDFLLERRFLISLGVFILVFISFVLQFEYFQQTKLRWKQANYLQEKTGLVSGIFVDGVYAKYSNAKKEGDYTGAVVRGGSTEYYCYVIKNTDGKGFKLLGFIEEKLEKRIGNPRIYDSRKPEGIPSIDKHMDELIMYDEYFSPLYSIIGKRAFVGSWCDSEFLDKIPSAQ